MARISGSTKLLGIIGWPVSHSFSPAMHNAAATTLGLDYVYVPLPVRPQDVETAVPALPTLGIRGVNVTVPHKQAVIPLLNEIEDGARAIGAVNTIVIREDSTLHGHNTDWSGFLADLAERDVAIAGRDCLILGAGGSARAVAYALAREGGRVQVLARRIEQAEGLVADLSSHLTMRRLRTAHLERLANVCAQTETPLIVNTTPLGMAPNTNTSVWPDDLRFSQGAFAYDLVYNPAETKFMQQAQAAGCRSANGLGMLLHQGALAFELWTGVQVDTAVMARALEEALS